MMMHHGHHHGHCHGGQVMPMTQAQPVVCPTQYRCHNSFIPREVPYIHPFVNVNVQHYVDVPRHYYTETNETVMGPPVQARPGCGPTMGGGFGRGFGRGRRPWR
ncbi:hypothetical protein [Bacillus sp. OxB-1]|uniref:hypothetical protein n=1 Tax=Bacillus sp. (strain OxB-1) TaxID=98228 RepID=UPI000A019A0C|nr:hypothetical protein [Bacillus sp. OxB-1]